MLIVQQHSGVRKRGRTTQKKRRCYIREEKGLQENKRRAYKRRGYKRRRCYKRREGVRREKSQSQALTSLFFHVLPSVLNPML